MKKKSLFGFMFVLFAVSGVFAANGDLIVNGKVGIGTSTPSAKLEMCDGGACIKWVRTLGNFGGDKAVYLNNLPATDTCNGDDIGAYSCAMDEARTCVDRRNDTLWWDDSDGEWEGDFNAYYNNTVNCYLEYTLVSQITNTTVIP